MGFIVSICIASIAAALFRLLVPENKFSKQLSLLTVCVFLLTGISAVSGAEFDLEDSVEIGENADYIRFSGQVDEELKQRICEDMEEKIRAALGNFGLYPQEVHIIVNISGLYSISITEVKVLFGSGENLDAAKEILEKELSGEEIKITVGEKL